MESRGSELRGEVSQTKTGFRDAIQNQTRLASYQQQFENSTKVMGFGKWFFCAICPLKGGIPSDGKLPYLGGEQFWGRAVRASRDFIIRGASYLQTKSSSSC